MSDKNLELWNAVCETDPTKTKGFKRGGGFSGTAINPLYLIRKATERWGPMGTNWGITVIDERYVKGAPIVDKEGRVIGNEVVHVVRAELRYPDGVLESYGQTAFVGNNKYGPFTDEEAPKKSLTDALTKGLSWLGFSADVHMGLYDDSKYVNDMKQKYISEDDAAEKLALSVIGATKGLADLQKAWAAFPPEVRKIKSVEEAKDKKKADFLAAEETDAATA